VRLDDSFGPADEPVIAPQPRRNYRTLAMLLAMAVWPIALYFGLALLPAGGAVFSYEDDAALAAASAEAPALPRLPAGEGQRAGPPPFWVDPPPAVRMKIIIPPEQNPAAKRGRKLRQRRDTAPAPH
jgi:hypothetical protein